MIGLNEGFKSPLPETFYGKVLIHGYGFPNISLKEITKLNEKLVAAAEAFGEEPDVIYPNRKEHGLSLRIAIIEHSNGDDLPMTTKLLPDNWKSKKDLGNTQMLSYNQLPLPWVYEYSNNLQKEGKQYGYNFQKTGLIGPINNIYASKKLFGALHPNPNIAKDWDNNVSASEVAKGDEMYAELLAQEAARHDAWSHVCEQWNVLSEKDAEEELLEGIARRLCLRNENNKLLFPKVGMTFITKFVVKDGKYPEPVPFLNTKEDSIIFTETPLQPMELEDVDLFNEILKQRQK
jgi:hypothetical protein